MPWLTRKRDEQWCVYKEGEDGEPMGDALGCHDSEAAADDQRKALYANVKEMDDAPPDAEIDETEDIGIGIIQEWKKLEDLPDGRFRVEIREIHVHELRGSFPNVDTYPSVDVELLTQGDPKPFYIVLPIARAGKTSLNRLDYDEALVNSIAEQLPGLGGIRGHIPEEQSNTAFPIEDVDWVGHRRVGATLYAKGYIPPGETREYTRRVKARNGKLSTSVQGEGIGGETADGRRRLLEFNLHQVDLAPAKKAALQLGGDFEIVTEMTDTGDTTMPLTKEDLAGMSASDLYGMMSDEQCEGIATMQAKKKGKKMIAAEMVSNAGFSDETVAEFEQLKADTPKLLRENKDLTTRIAEYERVEYQAGLEGIIDGQFKDWQNVDKLDAKKQQRLAGVKTLLRQRVVAEMDGKQDLAVAKAKADAVMERDDFRPVVEMLRDDLAGTSAIIGNRNGDNPMYARAEALKKEVMGNG